MNGVPKRPQLEPNRGLPIYFPQAKKVILPVYKCGSTATHRALGSPTTKPSLAEPFQLRSFSDLIYYRDVEKITMVRNPYDRVVSLWTCGNNNIDALHTSGNSRTFEEFVDNIAWLLANGYDDGHYCPMVDYLSIQGEFMADTVFKLENIDEFIRYIPELGGAIPKENSSNSRFESYRDYYLDSTVVDKVTRIYEKDIERFGYSF